MDDDKSAFVIAYLLTGGSGFVMGLLTGWLVWG